ncbi:MAG: M56 family metallopeptidase [Spirulinaceae cyanobacterium RM2_2_10]|nr:M56 family metallopeptidase [Spirulinaceae cyanobacterium RM2_2_10]
MLIASIQAWQTHQQICRHPLRNVAGTPIRLLPVSLPFAAQIGFWSPDLAVSQGLLDCLTRPQIEAVLAHERAHHYYRDTFWFFWWGWLRRLTSWLPRTELLWQELLLLRELRADAWAARQVDPLLLAESLLEVVQAPMLLADDRCAAFADCQTPQRFAARIEALIAGDWTSGVGTRQPWRWLTWGLAIAPFALILWHH